MAVVLCRSPLSVCCSIPIGDTDAAAAVPTWLDFLTLVTSETVRGVIHEGIPTLQMSANSDTLGAQERSKRVVHSDTFFGITKWVAD